MDVDCLRKCSIVLRMPVRRSVGISNGNSPYLLRTCESQVAATTSRPLRSWVLIQVVVAQAE